MNQEKSCNVPLLATTSTTLENGSFVVGRDLHELLLEDLARELSGFTFWNGKQSPADCAYELAMGLEAKRTAANSSMDYKC